MKNPYLAKFAAHLAKSLNASGADGFVRVKPFEIWSKAHLRLAHGRDGEYLTQIVGAHLMGLGKGRDDAEEAAMRWMNAVLDRPLRVKAGFERQQAHVLFAALVGRATDVREVELRRSTAPLAEGRPPASLRFLADRLAARTGEEGKGPPLWLRADDGAFRVPDRLSVWGAIAAAPDRLRVLTSSQDQEAFIFLMIRALETVNVGWGRAVSLGLSPWDYDLPVNQIKSLDAFIRRAGGRSHRPSRPALEAAWSRSPVTNFATLDEFLNNPLGRDIFAAPSSPVFVPFDEERDAEIPIDTEPEPPHEDQVRANLGQLADEEAIEALELRLCLRLMETPDLKRIWTTEAWVRQAFGSFESLLEHTDMLIKKLDRGLGRLNGGDSEDS